MAPGIGRRGVSPNSAPPPDANDQKAVLSIQVTLILVPDDMGMTYENQVMWQIIKK